MWRYLFSLSVIVFSMPVVAADSCAKNQVELQVLGSGGPEMDDGRASSSYLIWSEGKARVLVDAGTGSSLHFEKAGGRIADLQAILLTHLHVDHSQDLPAYIKASFFTDRQEDLPVLGPQGNALMPATSSYIRRLLAEQGAFAYLQDYVIQDRPSRYKISAEDAPIEKDRVYQRQLNQDIRLKAIPVDHGPVAALAWRVEINNCVISFSGDMSNKYQVLADFAKDSDMLVAHNAVPESARGVARNLHMPPSEIGKIAQQAKVQKLILSHRMHRTTGNEQQSLKFIRQYYQGKLEWADDMQKF